MMGNRTGKRRANSCPVTTSPDSVNFMSFSIVRSIGKGGYGKVCIAQKKDTKQMFAMKYVNKNACIEAGAVQNILQELRILKSIHHPYIVNLRYAFHDIEDIVLVVDLLQGGDLRFHLDRNHLFSEHDLIMYLVEMASALDYLHAKQIIHRDIKPDNILLSLTGHAHLTDFNIATRLGSNQTSTRECGTGPYIAPEVFASTGYSYTVDWWSLGVTMYELTHKMRPFDFPKSWTAALSVIEKTRVRYASCLSPNFVTVLKSLLTKDPTKRISSGSQISGIVKVTISDIELGVVGPEFKPSMKKLNVDPTFQLEELIIESKPIHKKSSRLSKSSKVQLQRSESYTAAMGLIEREFSTYNREIRESDEVEAVVGASS